MIVGSRYGLWMVIVQTWTEAAQNESIGLKSLMHRRRLMDPPGYGLKIVYGKAPGKMIPIPSHKIEGMASVNIRIDQPLFFDLHLKISKFIMGLQVAGQFHIPFAEWRMFHQLTKFIAVAFGRAHRGERFHDQEAVVRGVKI